jgi:hypothetical protein
VAEFSSARTVSVLTLPRADSCPLPRRTRVMLDAHGFALLPAELASLAWGH